MKKVAEHIYQRGQRGILYIRRRIPRAIRTAYPQEKTHITLSLGTSDLREGKVRARAELQLIDAEFEKKQHECDLGRASWAPKSISSLTDEQLRLIGQSWMSNVLVGDEKRRHEGLDDEDFDELGAKLMTQRAYFGRLLAQGKTESVLRPLFEYLSLCGMDYVPSEDEAKRAGFLFTRAVVETLDHQLARQGGGVLHTDTVAPEIPHPLEVVKGVGQVKNSVVTGGGPTWDEVFELWRDYVFNRPKSTTIAAQTPWRDLRQFVEKQGVMLPGNVTALQMTEFTQSMSARGLAVPTMNERISKIKAIYKIAVGRHKLEANPAADTLGFKESSVRKRVKRRLPFTESDLAVIFSSQIFIDHKRSSGQSGEASYWLPILSNYTGARPEELAGLALSDIQHEPDLGWYIRLVDSPTEDESDLFDEPAVPVSHQRTLKNSPSVRRVPMAQELIDLGLLRYIEWLRNRGSVVLFPTLKKDWHEKLSGSFSKFFGRYKIHLGIKDPRKVFYSFRHTMKNLLEQAEFPTKYLQRFLGHTSGDGAVTDGYGSDLPLKIMFEHFSRIRFPAIAAKPWQLGTGSVRF